MKSAKNISITVPPSMLREAERIAQREGRTKSELFREALRRYIVHSQFRELQRYGVKQSRKLGLKETDVERLISEDRTERRRENKNAKA